MYYRKIIHISAEDSPNVQLARRELAAGLEPSNQTIVPGVLSWEEYQHRRRTWDKQRQCIGLDGQFWEGAETWLYPAEWRAHAAQLAKTSAPVRQRKAKGLGVDPAEGGDNTAFAVIDEYGLMELVSYRTPDTNAIFGKTMEIMRRYNLVASQVCFDRGGGGRQHADRLRAAGYQVRTVAFGDVVQLEPRRGLVQLERRKEVIEERSIYKNRRAQMYGEFRDLMNPAVERLPGYRGYAIPNDTPATAELHRQMSLIPLEYDDEGKLKIRPKGNTEGDDKTLVQLLGRSPDELDAVVLACHAWLHKAVKTMAGVVG